MLKFPDIGYEISENAMAVLNERYLFRDEEGNIIENPSGMFKRVADFVAGVEKTKKQRKYWSEKFYDLMASGDFMPNSPCLMNANRKNFSVMSGCFVFEIKDSIWDDGIASIFGSIALMALIHKMGGGTGCSYELLRPANSIVSSTGHVASGPVSFMRNHDEGIESIQQGGMRRGAHASLLRVTHPDIREFITCKNKLDIRSKKTMNRISKALNLDPDSEFYKIVELSLIRSQLTNMNISISITRDFKRALENNGTYDLVDPKTGKVVGKEKAEDIFNLMAKNAWMSGEPGFIDFELVNRDNPLEKLGMIYLVNPCGEQPLRPYESCCLGSIAWSRMLKRKDNKWIFDFKKFRGRIKIAVRFLDNIIDAQSYPIKKIETETKRTRKIGLGIMGFADYLIYKKVRYGHVECMNEIDNIGEFFDKESFKASAELGKEKGNFPAWKDSDFAERNQPMRNAMRTTIAPTGTISGIAGVSFGIEPWFALSYIRKILDGKEFKEVCGPAIEVLKEMGQWNKEVELHILKYGDVSECEALPLFVRDFLKVAHEIHPNEHVMVQARFQRYINNAVSKTVNLSKEATVQDVKDIFKLAIEMECKGVTVFRDGSRGEQVLMTGKSKLESIRAKKSRPRVLEGATYKKSVGDCGELYITINSDTDERPFEVFIEAGKAGGCMQAMVQAIGRLISLSWRSGIGIDSIVRQLKGVTCLERDPVLSEESRFLSCSDAIARIIEEHFADVEKIEMTLKDENLTRPSCKCGGTIVYEGRCGTCNSCLKSGCA